MSIAFPRLWPLPTKSWAVRLNGPWLNWVSPIALLLVWNWVTHHGIFSPQLLVPPQQVWAAAVELYRSGDLWLHVSASLYRLFVGFAFGAVIGLAFGVVSGLSPRVASWTGSTFNLLRQVPSLALVPPFILIFGVGETFKIVIVAKAVFFSVALAASEGVKAVPKGWLEVGAMYRLTGWQRFARLIFPPIVPPVLTGMRIGLNRAWMVLVTTELLASESGLGQMMEMARQMFQMDVVMVGVVLTGVIGFALDRSFKLLERALLRWQRK